MSSDYLGCYNTSGFVWDDTTAVFEQMTIQQCVEWCRGRNKAYANLLRTFCACSDSLTEPSAGENCYKSCSGQENQICGGDGTVSVFNVCKFVTVLPAKSDVMFCLQSNQVLTIDRSLLY